MAKNHSITLNLTLTFDFDDSDPTPTEWKIQSIKRNMLRQIMLWEQDRNTRYPTYPADISVTKTEWDLKGF